MYTTPKQKTMDEQTQEIAQLLTDNGYEWLWANGKGGGFWVRGLGYKSLDQCKALTNASFDIQEAYYSWKVAQS